jgi:methionyl aminopeptidase
VRPGVTTGGLDAIAARIFRRAGARSAPALTYGFPGATCICVNDEAVHGIPGPRRLRDGDLVKLDVAVELNGFYADACVSVGVRRARPATNRLAAAARHALAQALHEARAGAPQSVIGVTIEREDRPSRSPTGWSSPSSPSSPADRAPCVRDQTAGPCAPPTVRYRPTRSTPS